MSLTIKSHYYHRKESVGRWWTIFIFHHKEYVSGTLFTMSWPIFRHWQGKAFFSFYSTVVVDVQGCQLNRPQLLCHPCNKKWKLVFLHFHDSDRHNSYKNCFAYFCIFHNVSYKTPEKENGVPYYCWFPAKLDPWK